MNSLTNSVWTCEKGIAQRILGTLSLIALLVLIFQVELILATELGYQSVKAMLSVLPVDIKKATAFLFGPFLHRGASHLVKNLGVLLVFGSYLEWMHKRKTLYVFFVTVGYLAAWPPILLGAAGAVGASGVTFGLVGWAAIYAMSRIIHLVIDGSPFALAHLIMVFYAFGFIRSEVLEFLTVGLSDAGVLTHVFGIFLGLVFGISILIQQHGFPEV